MSGYSNLLKLVRPGLLALVDDLVAKGAERNAVIYMIEKEATQLRDHPPPEAASQTTVAAEASIGQPSTSR